MHLQPVADILRNLLSLRFRETHLSIFPQVAAIANRLTDVALETFDQRGPIHGLLTQPLVSFEESLALVDLEAKRYAFSAPFQIWKLQPHPSSFPTQALFGHCQVHNVWQ